MSDYFYTWTAQRLARGLDLASGDGVFIEDRAGARWLDLGSMSYQANLGARHPRMVRALVEQAETMALAPPNADYPGKSRLAAELLAIAPPGFSKVFFTLGGSEAVENALKMARLVTGRHKLVSRQRSYHGATMGALSVTGDYRRPPLEPLLGGVFRVRDCYCDRCPFDLRRVNCDLECALEVEEVLAREGDVAAAIFETVVGANGVLIPADGYWQGVREACDRHGAVLIADEVLSGFGRTGERLAIDHYGVIPDMIVVAKALTAGYAPLGAVLVHERLASYFDDEVLYAGLTNYGHPLGIAAANEAMAIYRDEGLHDRARRLEPRLRQGLEEIAATAAGKAPFVRVIGLLGVVELEASGDEFAALRSALDSKRLIVHLYPNRKMLVVAPALNIDDEVLGDGLRGIRDAVHTALG